MGFVLDSKGFVKDMRRHVIRVRNISDCHPRPDGLINSAVRPVVNSTEGKHDGQSRGGDKCEDEQPFFPAVHLCSVKSYQHLNV